MLCSLYQTARHGNRRFGIGKLLAAHCDRVEKPGFSLKRPNLMGLGVFVDFRLQVNPLNRIPLNCISHSFACQMTKPKSFHSGLNTPA